MAAPNMNGRLHSTGLHQKPPASFNGKGDGRSQPIRVKYFSKEAVCSCISTFVSSIFDIPVE